MELNEEQKLLLEQLDKACKTVASGVATRETEEQIVRDPSRASTKEADWNRLYEKNYKDLFSEIKTLFMDFSKIHELLEPYLNSAPPAKKEAIVKDFHKILSLRSHLLDAMSQENFSLQAACGVSMDTLHWIYNTAVDYIEKQEWHKGATLSRYINFLNPYIPDSWVTLGYSLMMQQQFREALQALAAATMLDPQSIHSRLYSAQIYLILNEKKDARIEIEQFEKNLVHHPQRQEFLPYLQWLKNEL